MRYTLEKECFGHPENQAIFIVPGWAMPKESMHALAKSLSETFFITLINLPGVSVNPELIASDRIGPNYDIDALSEQLIAAAPEDAWWVGWSLGGMIASYVAARRSSNVKGLITIASTPAFVQREGWQYAMPIEVYDEFASLIEAEAKTGLKRFVSLQTTGAKNQSSLRKSLSELVNGETSNPLALAGGLRLLRSLDVRRELEVLDVPSLHLLGKNDVLVNSNWVNEINNEISPLQSLVLDGISHQPFMEDLALCRASIEKFINAH